MVVILVLVIWLLVSIVKRVGMPKVDPNVYQSIFIEGNQQYFGHLKGLGTRYPYLTDIYYVKMQQNGSTTTPQLIKLGSELHGPEDVMYLNWDKVFFWENLKPDSQVVQGISRDKVQRASQQIAPQPAMPAPVPQAPVPPLPIAPAQR